MISSVYAQGRGHVFFFLLAVNTHQLTLRHHGHPPTKTKANGSWTRGREKGKRKRKHLLLPKLWIFGADQQISITACWLLRRWVSRRTRCKSLPRLSSPHKTSVVNPLTMQAKGEVSVESLVNQNLFDENPPRH